MKNSFNVKFALTAIAVALILTGLVFTEVLQSNAKKEYLRKAEIQRKLEDTAPALLQKGIDKILGAQELSFSMTETFSAFGCEYTTIYEGRIKDGEQYAKNNVKYDNNAVLKDICPTQYNEVMSNLSGEHYWNTASDSYEYSPVDQPTEYRQQFFRENVVNASIQEVYENPTNILMRTKYTKDDQVTTYTITINKQTESIQKITFTRSGDSSLTSDTGDIIFIYDVDEVAPARG